ncbi:MAG: hypothetical protein IJP10_01930 [Clostridia bacterium]|nr:hypothetical protein [Clostridia bacterium]
MRCPYYKYHHGVYCTITQRNTNNDVYNRYCSTYSYDKCPIYKDNNKSSGGCYLTSACVDARSLPDDCHELTSMRALRDKYIRTLPEGDAVISDYYRYAPEIVEKINQSSDSKTILEKIYTDMILPCVKLFDAQKYHEAYILYKKYAESLKAEYLGV